MAWVHRVSSQRFFPFYVCVTSDEAPVGEVLYAHPDLDEDLLLGEDADWTWVERCPENAVLGRAIAHRSEIRPKSPHEPAKKAGGAE